MTLISIRERGLSSGQPAVAIGDQEFPLPHGLTDPFSPEEEERLEWYFEKHMRFPFVQQVKAREAAQSVTTYGHKLFDQVFADRLAFSRYQAALQQGVETLSLEVVGSPEFHRFHWEALKDPGLPLPLALQTPMVRRNLQPRKIEAHPRPSPTLNLLVVTARPGVERDVGYRTISRPLVESLRQANLRVSIDILRPGTYEALEKHLRAVRDRYGAGYYHVIHFDVHGLVMSYKELQRGFQPSSHSYQARYGRQDITPYEGSRAYLFLEGEKDEQPDPVEADELAKLLTTHQIPIAILNACQSGKQVGGTETSLGSRLMQAGMQMVLAMGYTVTVSAARLMMAQLYRQLFEGQSLGTAIRSARMELYNRKDRRAAYDQIIELEDWLLPVVYQNQPQHLKTRDFTPEERAAWYARLEHRYQEPAVTYGFLGRDLDILHLEKRLLTRRNLVLVRGMAGAGKSTLLHHLGAWWQTTGLVGQVFYFGYDQRAWTRQQILASLGPKLFGEQEYRSHLQPLREELQQEEIARRLRAERHLLILELGTVAQEQRQWGQAEQYYQQALQICREFNDRYEQARTYHQLGIVAQEQRQWAQAEQHYQQALQIKIDFNDSYSQAITYHWLGRVALEQQQWKEAQGFLLKGLETFGQFNDTHSLAITLRSLTRLWQESGDSNLVTKVASLLGTTPAEAEELLRTALRK